MQYQTEQEKFWAGEFGAQYIGRNNSRDIVAANFKLFSDILSHTKDVDSIIELGANIGLNLEALKLLKPKAKLSAVEINEQAVKQLKQLELTQVFPRSIVGFLPPSQYNFVFTKTVLIHLSPEVLPQVYDSMHHASSKYICLVEYYNPTPTMVNYRSHDDRLFKRDFCGELMDRFPDLVLVNYGFVYHRDNNFPSDDVTWFLLEKR